MFSKFLSVASLMLLLVSLFGISRCENDPPEIETKIAKAVKKFDTDEQKTAHVEDMRKYHMDRLMHKRDQTVHEGIRTPKYSLKACINCHVPAPTAEKTVTHKDSEHFCVTCHQYVSVQLDCFQCHASHPDKPETANAMSTQPAVVEIATEGLVTGVTQ
jgi:predicted CXXCH cytochrome family protein